MRNSSPDHSRIAHRANPSWIPKLANEGRCGPLSDSIHKITLPLNATTGVDLMCTQFHPVAGGPTRIERALCTTVAHVRSGFDEDRHPSVITRYSKDRILRCSVAHQ
jgi:hypothetical protein